MVGLKCSKRKKKSTLVQPVHVVSGLASWFDVHIVRLFHKKVPLGAAHGSRPCEYGRDERHSDLLQEPVLFEAYYLKEKTAS